MFPLFHGLLNRAMQHRPTIIKHRNTTCSNHADIILKLLSERNIYIYLAQGSPVISDFNVGTVIFTFPSPIFLVLVTVRPNLMLETCMGCHGMVWLINDCAKKFSFVQDWIRTFYVFFLLLFVLCITVYNLMG